MPKAKEALALANPTEIDWARLAAYIDGEGAILINRFAGQSPSERKRMWLRVIVCNTDPRMPQWCLKTFGVGSVVLSDRRRKEQHRQSFRWQISCETAELILRGCFPYFIIKREEAEIAFAFQETLLGPGRPVPRETRELREQLRAQLHARKRVTPLYDGTPEEYTPPRKTGPKLKYLPLLDQMEFDGPLQ